MDEILGYDSNEQTGKSTRLWYADEATFAAFGREIYARLSLGMIDSRNMELLRKDGSKVWCRAVSRVIDQTDSSKGLVVVFEDITLELQALEQMRNARLMAEGAARMKSEFLANMSHEIRTPMNAIIGMSYLALKTELTPRQRDYLRKIQGSSQHLLGIINDILDLSKIEAGKMTVESISFELDRVLENVTGLIAERVAAKGLELILDIAADVPGNLVGDPLRVGQILINYANNAMKFTEKGEISIHVSVVEKSAEDVLLHFSVKDTGIGIVEEHRARLFQNFEQADASTTRKYGGTGLGLAISKQLAGLMGGEVGVTSEYGKGATFWFTARLGLGMAQVLMPEPDLRGRRVLVVDDNLHAREILCEMLRSMTFIVSSAASGSEAITEVTRAAKAGEPYEVVFLDWQMPILDGVATANQIKRVIPAGTPHMVMITAYGRDEVMRAAGEAGIEDLLIKPITPSLLFDTLMRILGGWHNKHFLKEPESELVNLSHISGARILLVEDNDLNQEVASELLHQAGFQVDIAENGAVAVSMAARQAQDGYDIVLMDMQMPVMDGLTATREIRKLPQCTDLPIVAMTANAMAGDRERCLESGMNDHVAKPIDPDDLFAKLKRWVRFRHPRPQLSRQTDTLAATHSLTSNFAALPGMDVKLGLRQSLGNSDLYASLLGKFVANQADFVERLNKALMVSDWSTATRLAHTLKGVAAQIGAMKIRELAYQIESAIKQSENPQQLSELLREISTQLNELVEAIKAHFPVKAVMAESRQVDWEKFRECYAELVRQLETDDFMTSETIRLHEPLLRAALGQQFQGFSELVDNFNYGDALDLLREFAAVRGN